MKLTWPGGEVTLRDAEVRAVMTAIRGSIREAKGCGSSSVVLEMTPAGGPLLKWEFGLARAQALVADMSKAQDSIDAERRRLAGAQSAAVRETIERDERSEIVRVNREYTY